MTFSTSTGTKIQPKKLLLDLLKVGIKEVKPKNILPEFLRLENNLLTIMSKKPVTYRNINNIIPICIGKASVEMAQSFNKIFKCTKINICKGIIVVNEENFDKVEGFKSFKSTHPLPSSKGIDCAKYIINYLKKTTKSDLVLLMLSGGGSALLPFPVKSVSLRDKIRVNKLLLESGANIDEINAVRKHLSKIKGGNFVKYCNPSKVHSLILSDVIGDNLSSISSGLTVADPTTFSDVQNILQKYRIWESMPENVKNYILLGKKNKYLETPKKNNPILKLSKQTIIGSNTKSVEAIKAYCDRKNIDAKIWKKNLTGDVKKVSEKFAKYIAKNTNKKKPYVILAGGETTVKLNGDGKGGRNQELSIHFSIFAKKLFPNINYTFLSAGTDGRDGPTDAAGGIVDNKIFKKFLKYGININKEILNNNSYPVLKKTNSLIILDGTNTNVADLQIVAIW